MAAADWFLTDERPWTEGNSVVPLVHGEEYFAELHRCLEQTRRGDLVLFTDWRGDPDERLTDAPDSSVVSVLCRAAARGVDVRGLIWRSHLDKFAFSAEENRHLGERIEAAGGECLLDMRVRVGGSHHQKFVVLRHPGRPELDVAFVGGIDLCHSRRDTAEHLGDPQPVSMAAVYGPNPPWHDVSVALRGPAVADVEAVFRERWDDPQPLTRSPVRWLSEKIHGDDRHGDPLPDPLPSPEPAGTLPVQLLRTYPHRLGGYPFAPDGERTVARGYEKVLRRAQRLVYVEDQYLWSREVADSFAEALARRPELRVVAVLPHFPDQDGRFSKPPNLLGRQEALRVISQAGGDRFAVYGVENKLGTPVYVHAKVCVVDDTWATVGSDNFNRRSWTHDSELSAAVVDEDYARALRVRLMAEHTDSADPGELEDPAAAFDAVRSSAQRLEAWYAGGRQGERPPGRLRPLVDPPLSATTRLWAQWAYQVIYDPDGRQLLRRIASRRRSSM